MAKIMNTVPPSGQLVRVYRNLRDQCYSVRVGSKVVAHVDSILLSDVRFIVQKAGRQRVLREGRKNVHAFVEGYVQFDSVYSGCVPTKTRIDYNPYKRSTFFDRKTGAPVYQAPMVRVDSHGVTVVRQVVSNAERRRECVHNAYSN